MDRKICFKALPLILCQILSSSYAQSIEVHHAVSPAKPVLGDKDLKLQCNVTILHSNQQLLGINLERNRSHDDGFSVIVMFSVGKDMNATYIDTSLKSRTVANIVNAGPVTSLSLSFNDAQCNDTAQYKWVISYRWNVVYSIEKVSEVNVNVPGTFHGSQDYGVTVSPGTDVKQGTSITVKCKADVGNNPKGVLAMYYFLDGSLHRFHPFVLTTGPLIPTQNCSYTQQTELYLPMTRNWNGMLFRCVLQQNVKTEFGDQFLQTNPINVTYPPTNVVISSKPERQVHTEGEYITLNCSSDANPPPSYTWESYNTQVGSGNIFSIQALKRSDAGTYICKVRNGVPNGHFVVQASFSIIVEVPHQSLSTMIKSSPSTQSSRTPLYTVVSTLSEIVTSTTSATSSGANTTSPSFCSDYQGYPCDKMVEMKLCSDDHIASVYCKKTCGKCIDPIVIG